ncbi:MAG: site-2 protease family protein [Cyanobacteria bacterium P01_A01_bin.105]
MQSGWRVGSIFGIPLFIDTSWFFILLLMTFFYSTDLGQLGVPGAAAWGVGLVMALLLFGSVLLHELGHSLVARGQGIDVKSITLFLFGGMASIDKESSTPGQAFQVAIAGPLVSFTLFVLLTLAVQLVAVPPLAAFMLGSIAQLNLVLTLFNLIPGLPLDGGQILKAAVWKWTGSRTRGVRWAANAGQVIGWIAIVLGVLAYLIAQRLDLLWVALIGWFAVRNASSYRRFTDLQEGLSQLKATDAMTREFKVIDAAMTLRAFADTQLLQTGQPPVYFAASDGRYRGLVSIDDLRNVERSQWDTMTLAEVAQPLLEMAHVKEDTPLTTVITQLEAAQQRRITVLTPADAVAGVIDRGDIVRALVKQVNLPISDALIQRIKEDGAYPPGLQLLSMAESVD